MDERETQRNELIVIGMIFAFFILLVLAVVVFWLNLVPPPQPGLSPTT